MTKQENSVSPLQRYIAKVQQQVEQKNKNALVKIYTNKALTELESAIKQAEQVVSNQNQEQANGKTLEELAQLQEQEYFVSAYDIYNALLGSNRYIIQDLIPVGGTSLVYGSSSSGKSYYALNVATAIASQKETFLGKQVLRIKNPIVWYIATEDNEEILKDRLHQILDTQFDKETIDKTLHNIEFKTDISNIGEDIQNSLQKRKRVPCVIILDVLIDTFQGNMNNANEVRGFIKEWEGLFDGYYWQDKQGYNHKTHILSIHHINKTSEGKSANKNNVNGSQAFQSKSRISFQLSSKDGNCRKILESVKGNYLKEKVCIECIMNDNGVFELYDEQEVQKKKKKKEEYDSEDWNIIQDSLNKGLTWSEVTDDVQDKLHTKRSKTSIFRFYNDYNENKLVIPEKNQETNDKNSLAAMF